jgi:2-polyprenyl-3-methyl-5-hydroxy-6-metoxy-1,4-benzoquinol methylase
MAVRCQPNTLPRENVFGHTKKLKLILDALARLRRGGPVRVLDIGCGNGSAITRFLGQPRDTIIGIDLHEPSIGYARSRFTRPGTSFLVQDAESLLTEGDRFDAVIFGDILEHLHLPQSVLATGAQLLRPGGLVLATIPNGYGPFEIESWVSRAPLIGRASIKAVDTGVAVLNRFVLRDAWTRVVEAATIAPYNHESGHVQHFTRSRFLSMAKGAGLTLLRTENVSWMSGPYTNYWWAPSAAFCAANTALADRLPHWMASAWYFELGVRP